MDIYYCPAYEKRRFNFNKNQFNFNKFNFSCYRNEEKNECYARLITILSYHTNKCHFHVSSPTRSEARLYQFPIFNIPCYKKSSFFSVPIIALEYYASSCEENCLVLPQFNVAKTLDRPSRPGTNVHRVFHLSGR